MDPSGSSDIETAAPPAVSSLRSRFEQLGVEQTVPPASRRSLGSRSSSNQKPPEVSSRKPSQTLNGQLSAATPAVESKISKRAPPVPPRTPISINAPLPASSPLLRPVPTPPASPSIGQHILPGSSPRRVVPKPREDTLSTPPSGGVAVLKSQFV